MSRRNDHGMQHREEMVNVNEIKRFMLSSLVYPLCLNSIWREKKTNESKSKEFVKEIVDENYERLHVEKPPQQIPNSKYFF